MNPDVLLVVVGGSFVMSLLGLWIGASRGRAGAGFLCGFLLGPLGVILTLFLPEVPKESGARKRSLPRKPDPLEAWETQERTKVVPPVPAHLRGRRLDDE